VWLSYRFGVSLRDVSELMRARGIEVSREAIRLWTRRFGTQYARRLRRTRGRVRTSGTSMSSVWWSMGARLAVAGRRWRGRGSRHLGSTAPERSGCEALPSQTLEGVGSGSASDRHRSAEELRCRQSRRRCSRRVPFGHFTTPGQRPAPRQLS